ncbi:hypothetical protein SKP52_10915 [Sphingopyxis fribergensis]|uniref:TonB-dependent receptor n=1 Tax=Sphingopyxis fribergensis TaxID=1515612 RepID=A0A0A7PGH8_9SPHN|nr:hypothetical protein [Sphingopyxis fribergensis]AJA09084.1 hypothetical protein SKP52_10915 [Sphingopyxis fribergensis]
MSSREIVRFVRAISIPMSAGIAFHASIARSETVHEDSVQAPQRASETSNLNSAAPHNPDEIVVTATRRGEADVAAQDEFGEEAIASRGADNVRDLIKRLSPFIGESGDDPLILINGKPAGFDQSILYYPSEALERLAVLRPEAAAYYGEPAGKPVINLVLKKNFSMLNADAGFSFATAGGRYGGTLAAGRSAINGETRWNVQAQVGADSALFRSERNVPQKEWVREIQAPADEAKPVDPNRFETLEAARRTASLSMGLTRPLGDFSASVGLNVNRTSDKGLRGLPEPSLGLSGERALRNDNEATSLGATITLNGKIANWRTNLSLNYSRNWAESLLESGIDVERLAQAVGSRNPNIGSYGPWDESLVLGRRSKTEGEILSVRLSAQKSILKLPAGPMIWSINSSLIQSGSKGRQGDLRGEEDRSSIAGARFRQSTVQTGISIPITRRGKTSLEWFGDLSASLSASFETLTNSRARKRFGGSIFWTPWSVLELRGSIDFAGSAPSSDQISGPVVTSLVRVFDYERGEIAEPIWITGGNPDLRLGRRRSLTLASKIKPFDDEFLALNFTYRQIVAKGGIAPFPDLTPAVELAFSDRITRDAEGRLIRVDARAVNLESEMDGELSSSLALRWDQGAVAGEDPLQAAFSIGHRWKLRSRLEVGSGIPPIDQIRDSGQSRHSLTLDASLGKRGIGINLSGSWSSKSQLRSRTDSAPVYRFQPAWTLALSAFFEPDKIMTLPSHSILKGVKISADVQNLSDGYRRVTLQDGSVPAGYSRYEIDPVGRVAKLTLRKQF